MAFKIKAKELAELVGIAAKVSAGRSTQPVAESVRLTFSENDLVIDATNFETWLTIGTGGDVTGGQVAIVPCATLYALASKLPGDQDVSFSVAATRMTVKCGASKYTLGILAASEWPSVPADKKFTSFSFKAGELSETIAFANRSAITEEQTSQFYLAGMCFKPHANGEGIRFITADGHQLSHAYMPAKNAKNMNEKGVIVPRQTIALYIDMLSRIDKDTPVTFEASDTKCRLKFESDISLVVTGRLIDSTYPDIDHVVPFEREHLVNPLPRSAVIDALARMNIFQDDKKGGVTVKFGDGKICLSKKTERNDAEEVFDSAGGKKDACQFIVNTRYMHNLLSSIDGASVDVLSAPDERTNNSVVFVTDGAKLVRDGNFCLIAPMRG